MGRRALHLCLIASLVFGPITPLAYGGEDDGSRNIRLRNREPGLYLAPKADKDKPEAENFTTTNSPVAPMTLEAIEQYIDSNPALKDYKMVIIGPAVKGSEAETYKKFTEELLAKAGITPDVQIIRHPKTLYEKLMNFWPRREDYEKPIFSELKVAAFKILIAESLSFTVLLAPPLLQMNGVEFGNTVDSIIKDISLPLGTAIAMSVLDVANMVPLISYRRALSNWNIRLSPTERFVRQFLMGVFFSVNFYAVSQAHVWYEWAQHVSTGDLAMDVLKGAGAMASVVIPASIYNMLARTTVGTSLNIWEQRSDNRRFLTSVFEAVSGILIAPIYILSTMPVLPDLYRLMGFLDVNAAHIGLMGIGGVGGAAWAGLERRSIAAWVLKTTRKCSDALKFMGQAVLPKRKKPTETAEPYDDKGQET